jgi:transposase InsO family protein
MLDQRSCLEVISFELRLYSVIRLRKVMECLWSKGPLQGARRSEQRQQKLRKLGALYLPPW